MREKIVRLLRAALRRLVNGCRRGGGLCWRFLSYDKQPLGMNLLAIIVAVVGTLLLPGYVARELESERLEATIVIDEIKDLNRLTGEMLASTSQYAVCAYESAAECDPKRGAVHDDIMALHYKVIQLDYGFNNQHNESLKRFSDSLAAMEKRILLEEPSPENNEVILSMMGPFLENSNQLSRAIANRAELIQDGDRLRRTAVERADPRPQAGDVDLAER